MILAQGDAEIAKFVAGLVKPLLGKRDLCAGFRWVLWNPQKVRHRDQGVNPRVKTQHATRLVRNITDRRKQSGPVEHGFGSQDPMVTWMR